LLRATTATTFDANGASVSQPPLLKAAGMTGQITGSRAIADVLGNL
jgi:hypothetical protein